MGGHALRGVVSAWLALIVLQTAATRGSGRVGGLLADVNTLVKRALDPSVPAIPDRRLGSGTTSNYTTPAGLAGPYSHAPTLPATGRYGSPYAS